jgi:hypothetical protein
VCGDSLVLGGWGVSRFAPDRARVAHKAGAIASVRVPRTPLTRIAAHGGPW